MGRMFVLRRCALRTERGAPYSLQWQVRVLSVMKGAGMLRLRIKAFRTHSVITTFCGRVRVELQMQCPPCNGVAAMW